MWREKCLNRQSSIQHTDARKASNPAKVVDQHFRIIQHVLSLFSPNAQDFSGGGGTATDLRCG